ncbi:MAG TPA: AI-2E family transporter [Rubrobacteraceae bacterium]|nr:AI-2E family transporter [Rubrobacteraceae bacterium]
MKLDGRTGEKGEERASGRAGARARTPTPIFVSPRVLAVIAVVGIVVLAYVLYAAPSILIIALGGTVLAIILSFPVRALSSFMPRGLAILITLLGLLGLAALAVGFLVPLLVRQLRTFILVTPAIANSASVFLRELLNPLVERDLLPVEPEAIMAGLVQDLFIRAREIIEGILGGLLGFISGAFTFGVVLFGMLFVAVYLLVDVRKVKAAYLKAAPARYRRDARELWDAFGVSLSRYLGGLVFVVIVQGVLAGMALWALGVPYAILLGAWVSLTAIVPYLGPFLGAIPAIVVALTFGSTTFESHTTTAILTVVAYVLIQQFEGNFLTPRVQGQALHVHPIIVLLAVIGGAQLAGLAGVIFAVPALAVLRVFFDFFRARIRTSPELGSPPRSSPARRQP